MSRSSLGGIRKKLRTHLFEGDMLRLMALTLMVKPLGLITQMLTAKYFGAGVQYDAYALAYFLAIVLDNLVGQGYNTVVLPLSIRMRDASQRETVLRFQNLAALLCLIPVLVYMLALTLRTDMVVSIVAPGLPDEARLWVKRMVPWMALPGIGYMIVTMGKSVLNANRRYGVAGTMPLAGAVVTLAILALGASRVGIWVLPGGFLLATGVQLLIVLSFASRVGCIAWVRPAAPRPHLRQLADLGGTFMISQIILLFGLATDRYFAAGLAVGSLSSLAYTNSIINMGTQLFSMSVSVVMFTRMSEMIATQDMARCGEYIKDNINRQLRLVVPGSLALCLAAPEIVRVLFQRGAFGLEDAERTAGVMAVYVLALPGMVANTLVARVYHSLQRMRDRIWLNAQYVVTLVIGNVLLVKALQVQGIALAAVIGINSHLILSLSVLSRYRLGLRVNRSLRILIRSYLLGGGVFAVYRLTHLNRAIDGLGAEPNVVNSVLIAAMKASFVFGLYYGLNYLVRLIERSARR